MTPPDRKYTAERDRLWRLLHSATPLTVNADRLARQARQFREAQEHKP